MTEHPTMEETERAKIGLLPILAVRVVLGSRFLRLYPANVRTKALVEAFHQTTLTLDQLLVMVDLCGWALAPIEGDEGAVKAVEAWMKQTRESRRAGRKC